MNKWEKVASVTRGGKPYFWFKSTLEYFIWVVWDRHEKLWKAEIENKRLGPSRSVYNYYGTAEQGKKEVDKMIKTHKLVYMRGGADWERK